MSTTEKKDGWVGVLNGQPKVGQFNERSRTTKMSDIHSFTEITGDKNPVHYDEDLAKKTPFGKLIVQGGVTTGLLNACVAEDLPARSAVVNPRHHPKCGFAPRMLALFGLILFLDAWRRELPRRRWKGAYLLNLAGLDPKSSYYRVILRRARSSAGSTRCHCNIVL